MARPVFIALALVLLAGCGPTLPRARLHTLIVHRTAPRPSVSAIASAGTVNGYPCGGSLPTCHVLACESGGNPTAENPTSSASGLWQILSSTWAGFGGYSHASSAPVSVQNAKAAQLWAGGAGASHWAGCL